MYYLEEIMIKNENNPTFYNFVHKTREGILIFYTKYKFLQKIRF